MTDLVNDILIGNCFASEEELKQMAAANNKKVTFKFKLVPGLPEELKDYLKIKNLSRRQDKMII